MKKYEELWNKMKDLIRSKTSNSDNYNKKFMKIKFDSGDHLKKMVELRNMIMVVSARTVFHEDKKYYHEVYF